MAFEIDIRELARGERTFVRLKNERDESETDDAEDITGWAVQLVVKRASDDSAALFTLSATLPSPTDGKYRFTFSSVHSGHPPGRYPAEILFWDDGATTKRPSDATSGEFVITAALQR